MTPGAERRNALFLQRNLELLGFDDHASALVQATKELFENALDATRLSAPSASWDAAPPEMLRVRVCEDAHSGLVDVVCADTGSGIRTHELKQLCCGVFETTTAARAQTSGKYGLCSPAAVASSPCTPPNLRAGEGVGLKAAVLYSQRHVKRACLRIVTTSGSAEILYVQLRIDPESEEPAVVKQLSQFVLDAEHRRFSGTEMRLALPRPASETQLERAADTLATYFQTARYSLPAFLGVEFSFDVGGVSTQVSCAPGEEPIDRFTADLGVAIDDVVYVHASKKSFSINCMAVMPGLSELSPSGAIEICVLRFANHVPLLSCEDIALCGAMKGIQCKRTWKKLGLQCQPTSRHLVNQLVATPLLSATGGALSGTELPPRQLVIAIDVCSGGASALKYGCLKKSTLGACYSECVRACCESVLQQLVGHGALRTPQQHRDDDLLTNLVPLVANAVVNIASRPMEQERAGVPVLEGDRIDVAAVAARVRRLLQR